MNITGEQARLIAQTDAMVQQEQGRKWAEPQEGPVDEVQVEGVAREAGQPRVNVSVDPGHDGGAVTHFTVERGGRTLRHVDYTNMEANAEQFSGSLRQAIERAVAQFDSLSDALSHTADRFR